MSSNVLVTFTLTMTLALTLFYSRLRQHFSPIHELHDQIEALQYRVRQQKFKTLLLSYEFADFKTEVATLLPSAIKKEGFGEKSYPQRMLASVVQDQSNDVLGFQTAQSLFNQASRQFNDKNYRAAISIFRSLINNHPYSYDVPKAMFLIVEGSFRLGKYSQAIAYANQMIDLFPANELTGYAMIRMAQIYQIKNRYKGAADIYRTVMKSFSNRELAQLAANGLRQEAM